MSLFLQIGDVKTTVVGVLLLFVDESDPGWADHERRPSIRLCIRADGVASGASG